MSRQVGPEDDCNWSYPGSNTNVPTIMVLRPTWDEFQDFNQYMKKVEEMGAQNGGIAKIIPPKEWVPRREKFDINKCHIKVSDPIEQFVSGNSGIYNCMNVRKRSMSVKEFHKLATSAKYRRPAIADYKDLERKYWNNITYNSPIYGADVSGSVTDLDCKVWNIQNLGSILDWINDDYNVKIAGVNTAYLYFGMWKSAFAWHTEDMDLHSINYLHHGESKFWYSIPPQYARRFERMALGLFPQFAKECPCYLRHKMCLISPNMLRQNSIPYNKIAQKEGEIMITFPMGYHSGFNTGFNVAESTNFATERWVEYGKRASRCRCRPDTVNISMDCFVKRLQPERYDDWLNGKDYGRHPEEPNAKLTPAAPPTAEEFMVNNKNKDKEIPLCLLEPKPDKKRRHPIHKNKNPVAPRGRMMAITVADEDEESDCLDMDEDEPMSKIPRNQGSLPLNPNGIHHNSTNSNNDRLQSNKNLSHTSELWNSLDTIIKVNGGPDVVDNDRKIMEELQSPILPVKPKENSKTLATSDPTKQPSNLVDTISRLQRSLCKDTLTGVPIQNAMVPSPISLSSVQSLNHTPVLNGAQKGISSTTNNMRINWLHATPRLMGSEIHPGNTSQASMQYAQPPLKLDNNLHLPVNAYQQLTPPATGNRSIVKCVLPRSISSTPLQSFPNSIQGSSYNIKDYLGSLIPVQTPFHTAHSNTNEKSCLEPLIMSTQVQRSGIVTENRQPLSLPTSYKLNSEAPYSQNINQNTSLITSSAKNSHRLTAATQNLNLLNNLSPSHTTNNISASQRLNALTTTVVLTPRYSGDLSRTDWARSNQLILTSKDRRQIKTSVTILERQKNGSPWQPPLKLPIGNAWGWQVNGFVNMFESAIYINLHGPRNMARSFMLPFRNILATTKKSQVAINAKQDIWPPSDEMLALCEDVSRWELHMCINPNTDIKATIIDPWKKTYLLTIPGKLLA